MTDVLPLAHNVLLAHGVCMPNGPAKRHFTAQTEWLHHQLDKHGLAPWQVGDGPRHPSRWQRYTSLHHPGASFPEALSLSLQRSPKRNIAVTTQVATHSLNITRIGNNGS